MDEVTLLRIPLLIAVGLLLFLGTAACSSDDDTSDTGDESTALPACARDAGAAGECDSARVLLECRGTDGVTQTCLSNDPSGCPAPSPSDPSSSCENRCVPGEYAVWCGGVGPGNAGPLPAGCRSLGALPSGSILGCCPCGA